MIMEFVDIDVYGEELVAQHIEGYGRRATDQRDTFQDISEYIEKVNEENFLTEGGIVGGWAPLAFSTVRRKRASRLDSRILHASYELRESLVSSYHPDAIRDIDDVSIIFGTRVPYAGIHREGSSRNDMPAREPMHLSTGRRSWIVNMLRRGILGEGWERKA